MVGDPRAPFPALGRCRDCGGGLPALPSGYVRCRRRTCPGYSSLWAGDQRRKLFVNLDAYAELAPADRSPQVLLTAVTAPGLDQLPWDDEHCSVLGEHRHSGLLGCRVDADAGSDWNRSAPQRFRDLHRRVYIETIRDGSSRPWMLTRTWEMQRRGVLHVHPVLAFTTAAEQRAARAYLARLAVYAPRYGFGFVERKQKVMPARAAAAYLSSYFVTGSKKKATLQESVTHPEMPRSIIYVSPRLSMRTGCTMRRLRMLRFLHVRGWRMCQGDSFHIVDRYEGHPNGTGIRRVQEHPHGAP